MIYRCYRGTGGKSKGTVPILFILLLGIFWVVFLSGLRLETETPRRMLANSSDWLINRVFQDPRGMILATMPALAWQDTPEEMESPGRALLSWLAGIARVDMNPTGILRAQMPLLGHLDPPEVSVTVDSSIPELPNDLHIGQNLSQEVLVGIYTTHTGETYSLTDGTDRLTGKQGGVVKVARAVQKALEEKHAIRTVLSDKVHDARYATSYLESKKTAAELVEKYPQMIAMVDIHRDDGTREQSLVEVKGEKVAPISMIVGSDARMPFPNWKENYQFACRLAAKINEMYPGLCTGVTVKDGRFNQYLHPGAILVEVGTVNNYLEEALTSGEMLAEALAKLVQEEVKIRQTLQEQGNLPEKKQGDLQNPESGEESLDQEEGSPSASPLKTQQPEIPATGLEENV